MSKYKRSFLFIAILIAIFLVLKTNQNTIYTLLNPIKEQPNLNQLSSSWQFFNATSWQIPDKTQPKQQTYFTSDKTSFDNKTQTSQSDSVFIIQTKPERTIIISGGKAITKNKESINLYNNVQIETIDNNTNEIKLLKTEQIAYNDKQKTLNSEVLTSLQQKDFSITGDSLSADLVTGNYKFKGNVKTVLTPYNNDKE